MIKYNGDIDPTAFKVVVESSPNLLGKGITIFYSCDLSDEDILANSIKIKSTEIEQVHLCKKPVAIKIIDKKEFLITIKRDSKIIAEKKRKFKDLAT